MAFLRAALLAGETPMRLGGSRLSPVALVIAAIGACGFILVVIANPPMGLGLLGLAIACALAFLAPVAHVTLLLIATAVVPYSAQNHLGIGIGAGTGKPGLLLADLLLLGGLARVGWLVARRRYPTEKRTLAVSAALVGFVALASLQFLHGLLRGHDVSLMGAELRVLLGFTTFVITVPLLADPRSRRPLLASLLAIALMLGTWGMIQWVAQIPYSGAGDYGIRPGVRLAESGIGSIQGGLFGFPVAVIGCYAALVGMSLGRLPRATLVVAIMLNSAALVLTFERTLWFATFAGLALATMWTPAGRRRAALKVGSLALALTIVAIAVFSPSQFRAAAERLASIGQYRTDNAVNERIKESRAVIDQIANHPLEGSGLGSEIFSGHGWVRRPADDGTFTHNGYLWLAWKVGIPAALVLVATIGAAVGVRRRGAGYALPDPIRIGAQGALAALLVVNVAFNVFRGFGITAVVGLLLALVFTPRMTSRTEPLGGENEHASSPHLSGQPT